MKIQIAISRKRSGSAWGQQYDNVVITVGEEVELPEGKDTDAAFDAAYAALAIRLDAMIDEYVGARQEEYEHESVAEQPRSMLPKPQRPPQAQPAPQGAESQGVDGFPPDDYGRTPGTFESETVHYVSREGNALKFWPLIKGEVGQYPAGPKVYLNNSYNLDKLEKLEVNWQGLTEDMHYRLPHPAVLGFRTSQKSGNAGGKRFYYRDLESCELVIEAGEGLAEPDEWDQPYDEGVE